MSIISAFIFLAAGLVILWKCADLLVSAAVALAKRLGVSTLVIGLTIVAMGTSAPELAASITAAVRGAGDVAIGNVYGSNIANLALVGGLIALIRPLAIQRRTIKREMPVMILVALLLWPVLRNLELSRPEGLLLLAVFAALILLTVYSARKEAKSKSALAAEVIDKLVTPQVKTPAKSVKLCLVFILIGLAGLAFGADLVVRGGVVIGRAAGLSEAVIGQTIIAVGTSLPELVTCIVALLRKEDEISIGNLVGSNIFNTLLVVGAAGTVRPFAIAARLVAADYWIMVVVSVGFVVLALIGRRKITRPGGAVLFCAYVAYIAYLLLFNR